MCVLEINKLNIQYRGAQTKAVKNCSICLEEGEILGIVGESGSGKTTLAKAIMGFLGEQATVMDGTIHFDGADITEQKIRGEKIAIVLQNAMSCLNPLMKIGEQMHEGIRCQTKITRKESKIKSQELLDMVGIKDPEKCLESYPFQCSGGMQQRINIAIALSGEPKLLIVDEPTTALDVVVQAQILNLLKKIAKNLQLSIIFISHDLGVVSALCSRLIIMQKGQIVEQGIPKELFLAGKQPYTKRLVAAKQKIELFQWNKIEKEENTVLSIHHVTKKLGGKRILNDVSLEIKEKQVYGLAGKSGCGKSTLARVVQGIIKEDCGEIIWEKGEGKEKGKGYIQMIFQDPYQALNPTMSIKENMEEALLVRNIKSRSEREALVLEMAEKVGIEKKRLKDYPKGFSGGQLQRVAIARALLLNPELLICDEPFTALDVGLQLKLIEVLEDIKETIGFSMLFIGHDFTILSRISDVLGIMYEGMIVEEGPVERVKNEPWHPYTKMLLLATSKVQITTKTTDRQVLLEESPGSIPTKGCPFSGNCNYAVKQCRKDVPELYPYKNRKVRCFLYHPDRNKERDQRYEMTTQI